MNLKSPFALATEKRAFIIYEDLQRKLSNLKNKIITKIEKCTMSFQCSFSYIGEEICGRRRISFPILKIINLLNLYLSLIHI